jgi:hypothetical protein
MTTIPDRLDGFRLAAFFVDAARDILVRQPGCATIVDQLDDARDEIDFLVALLEAEANW